MLIHELPEVTLISVAHRAELEAFHTRKITLERRKGGAKLVSDIDLGKRKSRRSLLCAPFETAKETGATNVHSRIIDGCENCLLPRQRTANVAHQVTPASIDNFMRSSISTTAAAPVPDVKADKNVFQLMTLLPHVIARGNLKHLLI